MTIESGLSLYDAPHKNVFCGVDKYLTLRKMKINERMFPVMEDDSFFLLVRGGCGKFIINGVSFDIKRGCSAWIQCTHALTIIPEQGSQLELWSIVFDYQLVNYSLFLYPSDSFSERSAVTYGNPIIDAESDISKHVWNIFDKFDKCKAHRSNGLALIKCSLLGSLCTLFSIYNASNSFNGQPPLGWRTCIYIATHSTSSIDVDSAAKVLESCPGDLNRALRLVTGLNFEQMLNRCRCILAASYFLYKGLPLDHIAICSGFKSEVTFYRCFKKTMGMTPGEYRDHGLNTGKTGIYSGTVMDDRFVSIINYLYDNFTEQISLSDITKNTFISANIVRRLCSEAFGNSYKDILALFRIRYSESLLLATDLPLLDISIIVGFNSVRTFSRIFESINNCTPSEYRSVFKVKKPLCANGGTI